MTEYEQLLIASLSLSRSLTLCLIVAESIPSDAFGLPCGRNRLAAGLLPGDV
jgi:hypothetical protein